MYNDCASTASAFIGTRFIHQSTQDYEAHSQSTHTSIKIQPAKKYNNWQTIKCFNLLFVTQIFSVFSFQCYRQTKKNTVLEFGVTMPPLHFSFFFPLYVAGCTNRFPTTQFNITLAHIYNIGCSLLGYLFLRYSKENAKILRSEKLNLFEFVRLSLYVSVFSICIFDMNLYEKLFCKKEKI